MIKEQRAIEPQELSNQNALAKENSKSLLSEGYQANSTRMEELTRAFKRDGFVRLPNLFRTNIFAQLTAGVKRAERVSHRKNFTMPGIETPRKMSTLGARKIKEIVPFLALLYQDDELRSCLTQVVGGDIYLSNHIDEAFVLNFLLGRGETHGWHFDDPTYALIVIIESPRFGGGELQLLRGSSQEEIDRIGIKRAVQQATKSGRIETHCFSTGDAYLLKASEILHRVTPLHGNDDKRSAVNMAFCASAAQSYGDTATLLYG